MSKENTKKAPKNNAVPAQASTAKPAPDSTAASASTPAKPSATPAPTPSAAPARKSHKALLLLLLIPAFFIVLGIVFIASRFRSVGFNSPNGLGNSDQSAQDAAVDRAINSANNSRPGSSSTAKPSSGSGSAQSSGSAPAPSQGKVTGASLAVNSSVLTASGNDCGRYFTFHFTGTISTSGAATVSYRWVDPYRQSDWQNLNFGSAGYANIFHDVTRQSTAYNSFSGNVHFEVNSPNVINSNTVPIQFIDNCS